MRRPAEPGALRSLLTLLTALAALLPIPASAAAQNGPRWINAAPVLLRAEGRPDAPVIGRLQQATPVTLLSEDPVSGYCQLLVGEARQGHVACRFLSALPVEPRRAGQGDVPATRRWSIGSGLLLRAAPAADAPVLARLAINTELNLRAGRSGGIGGAGATGYCEVETLAIGPVPAQQGHTACALLAESPLLLVRLEQPLDGEGRPNPSFDPRKLFAVQPSWEAMARYEAQQPPRCGAGSACAAPDADFASELARMRRLLHGQRVATREPMPALPPWQGFDAGLEWSDRPDRRTVTPLWQLLRLPPARPSWFRSEAELASPLASMAQLAGHFDSDQQWFVGALYSQRDTEADARIERLGRTLQRIELLSDGSLRGAAHTPQFINREWRPDTDFMCQNWPGVGYAFGDGDAATWQRNGFAAPPTPPGPRRLFWFHSSRPLPPGPARVEHQALVMDREASGFAKGELRRIDLDADGHADLVWFEGTGRGPGHLDGPPRHDDPWWRLLLVNLNGEWRVLASDAFSYGCGC